MEITSCAVEIIGQLLGVRHMVLGSAGKPGKNYTLNARIVDIRTGIMGVLVKARHVMRR